MCGIVGLLLKRPALHGQLGELMVPMLVWAVLDRLG